jgi:hypothetical protein
MDITKLTDTELKALGYEQAELLNQTQFNLNAIRQELARRQKPETPVEGE